MLTRTHATTSLGDIDESHVHVAVPCVVGFSLITRVVVSLSLSLVDRTEENYDI